VAINMVTSIDGRAQLEGTAEGLGSRADRRLMRLYRAAFDAVASGVGTLRATGVWLRVGDDLVERRRAAGTPRTRSASSSPGPTRCRSTPAGSPATRGASSSWVETTRSGTPAGTELLRAPDERPAPAWVLDRLAERGIGSLLLEGGPHLNAAFLAAGLIDEVYWTVGPSSTGPMRCR
jgi:riboflavin biosynthesis pyrimidine reductase